MDPRERGVQLAACRQQLQRVEAHEPLRAQGRGHLRVELAQVQRARAQPGDHVALREPVLRLVVELDWYHRARLGRQLGQHVGLQAPGEAARAQVPVQAYVCVGSLEAAAELGSRAEVGEAPDDAQLRDQLGRAVHHGRARQCEHEAVARDCACQARDCLGALGGSVLAVVRLIQHERSRGDGRERLSACGEDVVVDDRDVSGGNVGW